MPFLRVFLLGAAAVAAAHAQTTDYIFETVAGEAHSSGSADGKRGAARFAGPSGLALDAQGDVFVADGENHTIRKITPAGVVTTLAGSAGKIGSADGRGRSARFGFPGDLAVDDHGNVFATDEDNATIRKIAPDGTVTTVAGVAGAAGDSDGKGRKARFREPAGIAVDGAGNLFVSDRKGRTIRKIAPDGTVTTVAGRAGAKGHKDGRGAAARFEAPEGLAVDDAGNLFVVDDGTNIRKITPAGVVTTIAGASGRRGSTDGRGGTARFGLADDIAVDADGNLFVADGNDTIRKVAPDGTVTTVAGAAGKAGATNGRGRSARFDDPSGVAVDDRGNLYVTESGNDTIRRGKIRITNLAPTISAIADQLLASGWSASVAFVVGDADTPASRLKVTAASSDPVLVPAKGLALSGSGTGRKVKITPAKGKTGVATITLTVSDGFATASVSFTVTVS